MDPCWQDYLHTVRKLELDTIMTSLNKARRFGKALEVGIGDGYVSSVLYEKCDFLLSTDISEQLYERNLKKVLKLVLCDARALPLQDKSFNSIFALNVLEHIHQPRQALLEIRRVLKPSGTLVVSLPTVTWKIFQLSLWYPYIIHRTCGMTLNWIGFGSKRGSLGEVLSRHGTAKLLVPPVHGAYDSHLQELIGLRAKAWETLFESCGFHIVQRLRLPCYSPYPFWLTQLRKLERLKLSSSHCYILKTLGEVEEYFIKSGR